MAERFGQYDLLELLGAGGMGEVFRAYDRRTKRFVALKRLAGDLANDSEFVARFRRECEITAPLEHEHIVPIYDYGEIDGRLYICMRLVEGRNLGTAVQDGRLTPSIAVGIVTQIASAIDYAHTAGVEHRDVKPTNIMLSARSQDSSGAPFAYLVDFGIARSQNLSMLTRAGEQAPGTIAYMAPERLTGGSSDRRADIYALACVLYESLTGQQPFPRSEYPAMLYAHLNAPVPKPSERSPGIPPALDEVIQKGMAKASVERYASAMELARTAQHALSPRGARSVITTQLAGAPDSGATSSITKKLGRPVANKGRRGVWIGLAALVVAAIVAIVAVPLLTGGGKAHEAGKISTRSDGPPITTGIVASPASATSPASGPQSTPGVPSVALGQCLNAQSDAVSCDVDHVYEVYATTSPCSFASLIHYLGGETGTDTVLPSVAGKQLELAGHATCVVQGPQGDATRGSARMILQSARGDSWRRCVDPAHSQIVPCDKPHTSEYVFAADVSADQSVNCTSKADAYLGAAFANFSDELSVQKVIKGNSVACVVSVRGGDVLTASLRSIGTGAPPLAPP